MLFFALLAVLTLLSIPALKTWPARMRIAMAIALIAVGADHWTTRIAICR